MSNTQTHGNTRVKYDALDWLEKDEDFLESEEASSEFASLLEETRAEGGNDVREGQIVKGKVVEILDESVIVDIGHKSAGEVYKSEFVDKETREFKLAVGDTVEVYVDVFEDEDGELVISKDKADLLRAWDRIEERLQTDHDSAAECIQDQNLEDRDRLEKLVPQAPTDDRIGG